MTDESKAAEATSLEQKTVDRWADVARYGAFVSVLTCGVLSLPAVALEVLALAKIRKLKREARAVRTAIGSLVASVVFAGLGFMGWAMFSAAGDMAKHINCLNNIKTLATAMRLYAFSLPSSFSCLN